MVSKFLKSILKGRGFRSLMRRKKKKNKVQLMIRSISLFLSGLTLISDSDFKVLKNYKKILFTLRRASAR